VICDRFGPSHDYAFRTEAKKARDIAGDSGKGPDERTFKRRIAAFIAVGGTTTVNWLSLGLPLMNLFTFSSQIPVVDQMQVTGVNRWGHVVLNDEAMARAAELGRHVVSALREHEGNVTWMGDNPGTCPVCHSSLLTVGCANPVECAICGIKGELQVTNGRITVAFTEEEQKRSRLNFAGKLEHFLEIKDNVRTGMARKDPDLVSTKLKKYEGYGEKEG
jgi:hypothetical protein